MKTNAEHAAGGGQNCPVCGSGNIDNDGGQVRQLNYCMDCPAEWNDVYQLTGFELTNAEAVNAWTYRKA